MNRLLKNSFVPVAIAAAFAGSVRASNLASDNASDPAYSGGIINGQNGGTGFGAWVETAQNGPSGSGSFIGDSTSNAGGSGGINSAGNKAWGAYANSGNVLSLVRPFTGGDLSIGQTFSIDFDNGWIESGNTVGLGLQNSSGENLVEVYYKGGDSVNSYKVNASGGEVNLSPNVGFTGNGLHLEITLTSLTTFSGTLTTLNPTGSPVTFSGTLFTQGGGEGITQVRLFNANAAAGNSGANWDAFYNNMAIVPEPSTIALVAFGLLGACFIRRRK